MTVYEMMIRAAMGLDRRAAPKEEPRPANGNGHHTAADGERPGDVFNRLADWKDILEPRGWQFVYERGGMSYWRRPGKTDPGTSATTGIRPDCGKDLLYVFTTNGGALDPEQSYSKFGAFATLNYGGDFSAAGKALLAAGWGDPSRPAGRIIFPAANGRSSNGKPPPGPPAWEEPLPLDQLSAAVPFPLDVLPGQLADYVSDCAQATGSPVDFVAVPVLALAAGCLGASRAVGITQNHVQPATLYAMVIGLPGTGKSPALDATLDPLESAEKRFHDEHKVEMQSWKDTKPEDRGRKPVLRRVVVDDTTSEALMRTLNANQRGVVMVRDELSALVAGFNQYKAGGKGADRQVYLKAWSAATIRVDRKTHEEDSPLIIRRPSLSIIGGVQPDVIHTFLANNEEGRAIDDGLLDRFLFSYPLDLPATEERFQEVRPDCAALWGRVVSWLLGLKQWPGDTGMRPKIVKLTESGKSAWVGFTGRHAAELNDPDFPDYRRGPWSKLKGYCARLALLLQFLHLAVENPGGWEEDVDEIAVTAAGRLIDYFKAHYLRVATRMGADPRQAKAEKVLSWLKRNGAIKEFSQRDVYRDLRASFDSPSEPSQVCQLLTQYGYLRSSQVEAAETGRKPGPHWEVNPLWDRS